MANAAIIRGIRRKIIEFIRGLSAPPEHRRGRSGISFRGTAAVRFDQNFRGGARNKLTSCGDRSANQCLNIFKNPSKRRTFCRLFNAAGYNLTWPNGSAGIVAAPDMPQRFGRFVP
jgi:hypothetical protein